MEQNLGQIIKETKNTNEFRISYHCTILTLW